MKKSVIITIIIWVIVFVLLAGLGGFFFVKTILNKEKDSMILKEIYIKCLYSNVEWWRISNRIL